MQLRINHLCHLLDVQLAAQEWIDLHDDWG
jgi:hypothetical protein